MRRAVIVFTVLIALLLSGCAFGAIEDMLSPPRLTDEQQAIYRALVDSKGTGFKLKYPRTGEHRSAFVVYGENEDSAIVFYEISGINIERSIFMNFLHKNTGGKWESLSEIPIPGPGTDIESISFAVFGADEQENILLSYTIGQSEKFCMIISNIRDRPVRQHTVMYSYMQVDYFLGREHKELLVIKNDRSAPSATATFYTYVDGQLLREAECELDPGAGEYIGITQGYAAEDIPALFINHRKHDSADIYGTDMLLYSRSRLINPLFANPENHDRVVRRTGIVTELANPRDIEGNGIIYLPSSIGEFPGYRHLPAPEKLRPVVWHALEGNGLTEKYRSYFSERCDFVFLMPGRWHNNVTAVVNTEENTISFFRARTPVEEADELILSIKTVFEDDEEPRASEWILLREGAENNLRYYINHTESGNSLTLTAEELENAFRILSEIKHEPLSEQ
ncbi:MAG: hypothetical protein LBC82_00100 [Oscillospiraceae bacterium]|jgi:hypothetical protein|nr:hypothetical protein [Oscillospiraceae bacterium]